MQWAFMTANYVAKELNYENSSNWGDCHQATAQAFHGPHFAAKFEGLIARIKNAGFDAIELWVAHLEPLKATPEMINKANEILDKYQVRTVAYTAGFGNPNMPEEDIKQIFRTSKAIKTPVLAQAFHPNNGPIVKRLAQQANIYVGLENHPEKTPAEVIQKVAPFSPSVGSAIDTGWFATQGYDAVKAVYELKDHLVHVHLKDVKMAGAHDTCMLGDGIVNIKGVLYALHDIGYRGVCTIEHEPHFYDPTDEIMISFERVKAWWAEISGEKKS